MTFGVNWVPAAERELAALWLGARDQQRITEGADRIDRFLRIGPTELGESRSRGRRIAFVDPLWIIFRVLPRERRVEVLHVWRI